jgi:UDP-galactopyranose mutase
MKIKIVGSGLSGAVAAYLLKSAGHSVKMFESRNHIGGNCYDSNMCGTTVHNYGPHIFHTDDDEVFKLLSKFTEWEDFEYKPIGNTKLGPISLPYSRKSVQQLGRELTQEEIIENIFVDYSEKQWGTDFDNIPKSITNRIPKTKDSEDPTWFEGQKYQCIPKEGYTKMFEKMLSGIDIKLGCGRDEWKDGDCDLVIFTGRVDEFYNFKFGELPYRSLTFTHEVTSKKQDVCVYNECNKTNDYTRKYDHSFFTSNHKGLTVITKEFSKECEDGDVPFYPIPWGDGMKMYAKYKELADQEDGVLFIGRLATYTYLDMWMAVKQAILKLRNKGLIL